MLQACSGARPPPPTSHEPALLPTVQASSAVPASSLQGRAATPNAAQRLKLESVPSPTVAAPWGVRFTSPPAGARLTEAEAPVQSVALAGVFRDETAQLWLKLDDHVPRRLAYSGLTLGQLADELRGLAPGPHRLLAFPAIADGRVLFGEGGQPLVSVLSFDVLAAAAGGVAESPSRPTAPPSPQPLLFGPTGTVYGGETQPTYLQVGVLQGNDPVALHVRAPNGATDSREVNPGCYVVSGLVSGDYQFFVSRRGGEPSSAPATQSTITVNLFESPSP